MYVSNLDEMPALNKVYFEEFFPQYRPARTCVQAARIARDALLELDAVISCGDSGQ
jgi:2-iminobutanoate/2-iminopropanoate deaminase